MGMGCRIIHVLIYWRTKTFDIDINLIFYYTFVNFLEEKITLLMFEIFSFLSLNIFEINVS
jgi:hypothetical protein